MRIERRFNAGATSPVCPVLQCRSANGGCAIPFAIWDISQEIQRIYPNYFLSKRTTIRVYPSPYYNPPNTAIWRVSSIKIVLEKLLYIILLWCDFDRESSLICGNKMPTSCNRGFYCRSYCLRNMFRASLIPSSGYQEYYTVVAACGFSFCGFSSSWSGVELRVMCPVRRITLSSTPDQLLEKPQHEIPKGSNHCIILLSSWWWA